MGEIKETFERTTDKGGYSQTTLAKPDPVRSQKQSRAWLVPGEATMREKQVMNVEWRDRWRRLAVTARNCKVFECPKSVV